jgi:hypothetical protein
MRQTHRLRQSQRRRRAGQTRRLDRDFGIVAVSTAPCPQGRLAVDYLGQLGQVAGRCCQSQVCAKWPQASSNRPPYRHTEMCWTFECVGRTWAPLPLSPLSLSLTLWLCRTVSLSLGSLSSLSLSLSLSRPPSRPSITSAVTPSLPVSLFVPLYPSAPLPPSLTHSLPNSASSPLP